MTVYLKNWVTISKTGGSAVPLVIFGYAGIGKRGYNRRKKIMGKRLFFATIQGASRVNTEGQCKIYYSYDFMNFVLK